MGDKHEFARELCGGFPSAQSPKPDPVHVPRSLLLLETLHLASSPFLGVLAGWFQCSSLPRYPLDNGNHILEIQAVMLKAPHREHQEYSVRRETNEVLESQSLLRNSLRFLLFRPRIYGS